MPKNRTIGIAISSALLVLSQADATQAAIPLAAVRVQSEPAHPPQMRHADGDFDRAFVVQRGAETQNQGRGVEESLGTPAGGDRQPYPSAPRTDRTRVRFIPATHPHEIRE